MAPLEPWKKVYIELTGSQTSFADIDTVHATIGCVNCHGGLEPSGYESAHDTSNGFVRDPSVMAIENCNPCHSQIVATFANSMHANLWGEQTAIAQRELGADSDHNDFDTCPEELTDGFDAECASCHATCGQCHLSRPNSVAGGLVNNHRFVNGIDQEDNCMACHGSRIGVDFRGELSGNSPDAHFINLMQCWDCHKREEMHADGSSAATRYHLADLPKCTECHVEQGGVTTNSYHAVHWPDEDNFIGTLSCNVCHSQPYNNCNSCHTNGEWEEGYQEVATDIYEGGRGYREYPEFRIGWNYDPDLHTGDWVVVRHIPVSRDTYDPWGHPSLANYDAIPTWKYSSPHNITRFTDRTAVDEGEYCFANCHLEGENAEQNQKHFLWRSFVDSAYADEANANEPVVVDDHLPDSWQY